MRFITLFCFVITFAFAGAYMSYPLVEQRCEELNIHKKFVYNKDEQIIKDINEIFYGFGESGNRFEPMAIEKLEALLKKYNDKEKLAYFGCVSANNEGSLPYSKFLTFYLPKLKQIDRGEIKKINNAKPINGSVIGLSYSKKGTPFDSYNLAIKAQADEPKWGSKIIKTVGFDIEYNDGGLISGREFSLKLGQSETIDGKGIYKIKLVSFDQKKCRILLTKKER